MEVPNKPIIEPVATVINGHTFTVDKRYILKDSRILGKGSFGVVCTAYDNIRNIDLAIKRIRPYANDDWDSRHTLREIRLLKLLGPHPNIITLFELSLNEPKTELYMMIEVMDCDLHRVIQSKQPLSEKHFKCFVKQILEGIKAMHAIGVFHRDLKPGNILVSKDCQLRITDFGLARFMDESTRMGSNQLNPMTEYVVTRWYRCPELLLSPNRPYNEAIDLWSIGCILAELLRRKPLFPGKSHANQVQLIFEVLGYNNSKDLGFPVSSEASAFLDKRCKYRKQPFEKVIPDASREALSLLEALLALNPDERPTAEQALDFPFLDGAEVLHDYSKNYLVRPTVEFFDFEQEKYSAQALKDMIEKEVRLSAAYGYQYEQAAAQDRYAERQRTPPPLATKVMSQEPTSRGSFYGSAPGDNYNQDQSFHRNINEQPDPNEGPASQLATQLRNSKLEKSKDNPFRSNSASTTAAVNKIPAVQPYGMRPHSEPVVQNAVRSYPVNNNNNSYVSSSEYTGGGASDNVLTAVRGESGAVQSRSRKTAPKTPSPQKVDAILQKDLNNKRRFVLEDLQRQRDLDAQNAGHGSNNDNSGRSAPDQELKKPSKWTFPSKTANATSNQDLTSYSQQQQQKPAVRSNGVPFPSLSRIGSFGSKATSNVVSGKSSSIAGKPSAKGSSTIMHSGSNIISGDHDMYADQR